MLNSKQGKPVKGPPIYAFKCHEHSNEQFGSGPELTSAGMELQMCSSDAHVVTEWICFSRIIPKIA